MALGFVVLLTVLVVCIGLVATCAVCLDRTMLGRALADYDRRFVEIVPYLGVTALFFLGKRATHGYSLRISEALDWDLTAEIYAAEGEFVAWLQGITPEATLEFFSAMYMFGFPYLLVTAPILYFLLSSQRYFKELLVSYLLNYLVGSLFYTLFIVYGPRNHLSAVDGLMYSFYPQTQEMTAAVSANTNVFPSLHTSLSVVVVLLAWRSRREYPRWFPIASFVGACVVFSTMYLGIHWLIDVAAGVVLGVGAVVAADRIVARAEGDAGPVPAPDEREDGIASDPSD
ncbi:phosphoesterase PA-phosphatase-like protein [Natrinema pellirubrum DSM 15624]|uniref:Phosphatidylinositol kinase and protein kinases of the PI-3 kinase family n=1 Tax=Natrinema pellirubrum (strain DSM 15624 / CIP 106293 / JCM 10476 / NCIMB 786 / 157) TaxID=797303 RepID=L0JQQ8_NATP1|nr:phosphatase PAP2 family protein [Natrinema pellirubrum]AGB33584.1 phosphatidylinositol kinase and protein kinases of the PI-3 kinase family [Natrinema pellirubrum DSM 15624]ELY70570.1 phosphoesterase PA-phosphatase-like protein [Natrinema pellirubrum DSM 15624]